MNDKNPGKLFNDCVHGHIELPSLCVAIIDTDIFQRLRNIKQLGFAYFVYPGASHNRFEHSLGVCYLAGFVADALNCTNSDENKPWISPEEKLCLQVAGLCHDLGHGPFSHTWERVLAAKGQKWQHEEMSIKMLDLIFKKESVKTAFLKSGLQEEHKSFIKNLIRGKKGDKRAFLYEIISNKDTGIDVDKWDYLHRDGKQLNINVTFDPFRLMKCQRIIKVGAPEQPQYRICYRDKDMGNIWHMYMMRAELHRMAYQHPVVKIIEEMFIDAILSTSETYKFMGKDLTKIQEDIEIFMYLTDEIFHEIWRGTPKSSNIIISKEATNLLHCILNRKLYHIITRKTLSNDGTEAERRIKHMKEKLRKLSKENNELDLYITTLEWDMQDLQTNVYVYSKFNLNEANTTDDWTSVPFYKEQVKHTEVLFYCKKDESLKNLEDLRRVIRDIEKEDETCVNNKLN